MATVISDEARERARRWWAEQKALRGPAPDHIVAAVNRALRAPRRGDGGDPNDSDASERLVVVAH